MARRSTTSIAAPSSNSSFFTEPYVRIASPLFVMLPASG
jgi:hypothetical protein